jgi:hypothetical protein
MTESSSNKLILSLKPIKISIIGSASSKKNPDNEKLLNADTWQWMCNQAEFYIEKTLGSTDWSKVHLVSGASSWSDHVAVNLYFKHPESQLSLHLPCAWDSQSERFVDTNQVHWAQNPGKVLNWNHQSFSRKAKLNSLNELNHLYQNPSPNVHLKSDYKGFHDRNLAVGKCQYLVAFSFSKVSEPTDGGTLHTWKHSTAPHKHHISLYH